MDHQNPPPPPPLPSVTVLPASSQNDYINDVKFDYYGRRIATCSGDQRVTIYGLDEDNNWVLKPGCTWKAHKGVVWRCAWAHPEFGQLIATCGADQMAHIWEEQEGGFDNHGSTDTSNLHTRWVQKAQLTEARKAVNCIEFAPKHVGLRVATGSADGVVRIYEAIDVLNLNHWPMSQCFDADVESELGVTCLSWCSGRFEPPMLVVGGSSGRVTVWRFSDSSRKWHVAAELPNHSLSVLDVSWAPNIGRSFHMIATSGKDKKLRLYKMKREKQSSDDNDDNTEINIMGLSSNPDKGEATDKKKDDKDQSGESDKEKIETQVLDTKDNDVWRLGWNSTGTVLATSGENGVVNMWKSDYSGKFIRVDDDNV